MAASNSLEDYGQIQVSYDSFVFIEGWVTPHSAPHGVAVESFQQPIL
jgi:hypothetical protein